MKSIADDLLLQHSWSEEYRATVAELYEQAFGQKFALAINQQSVRVRVLAEAFKPEYSFVVMHQQKVVAVAGFQTPQGSFTSDIAWAGLSRILGSIKGLWAAAVFSFFERKASAKTLVMDGIVVAEGYRGLGLGSMLLDKIVEHATELGFERVRLDVINSNPRAKKLYLAKGFEIVSSDYYPYLKWLLGFSGSSTLEYLTAAPSLSPQTEPLMNKPAMYSTYAKEYDVAIQDNIYNAHYERPSLQAMLGDVQGKHVLDLGCGSGVYAEYLLTNRASVTAIDNSEEMVSLVKQKLGSQLKVYQQDLAKGLPQEQNQQFDVVICPQMLHYLEDLNPLFAAVKRVLKPQGCFVFSTHHPLIDFEASPSGNYFATELITEEWDTVGKPVSVSFYRRSLSALISALTNNGMLLSELSEGKPSEALKELSPEHFLRLSQHPQFIFVKCILA